MHRRRFNLPFPLHATTSTAPNTLHQEGFRGFLSPTSTRLLLNSYHFHLRSVTELAFGSATSINQAAKDLFRIVEVGEREEGMMKSPRLLHHASQAWNLDFFLRGLCNKETEPPDFVLNIISDRFGSFDNFKRIFQAHASAMIGCGWIWLVKTNETWNDDRSSLDILTTFNGATPLFKRTNQNNYLNQQNNQQNNYYNPHFNQQQHISTVNNSPILGLNLWESAFILDYSLDRDQYVRNWWKAINWNVASVLLSK